MVFQPTDLLPKVAEVTSVLWYAESCHDDRLGKFAIKNEVVVKIVGAFETYKGVSLIAVSKDGSLSFIDYYDTSWTYSD